MHLFFLTIPEPLKQHPLFKKDRPSIPLSEPKPETQGFRRKTSRGLKCFEIKNCSEWW